MKNQLLKVRKISNSNYKEQTVKYSFRELIIKKCCKIKLKKTVIYKDVSTNCKIQYLK